MATRYTLVVEGRYLTGDFFSSDTGACPTAVDYTLARSLNISSAVFLVEAGECDFTFFATIFFLIYEDRTDATFVVRDDYCLRIGTLCSVELAPLSHDRIIAYPSSTGFFALG